VCVFVFRFLSDCVFYVFYFLLCLERIMKMMMMMIVVIDLNNTPKYISFVDLLF